MNNYGLEDELYKDRNKSFRKAVRAPKKNQRYLTCETGRDNLEDINENGAVKPVIKYSQNAPERTKYNWKQFLPWAPKTKR